MYMLVDFKSSVDRLLVLFEVRTLIFRLLLMFIFLNGVFYYPVNARAAKQLDLIDYQSKIIRRNSLSQSIYLPVVYSYKPQTPIINVPYFEGDILFSESAISWFGQVTPSENYADVRIGYNDNELSVHIAVIDRRLWYDPNLLDNDLTLWDATSLYLDLGNNPIQKVGSLNYRFDGQLNWWEPREDFQAAYFGSESGWNLVTIPFTTLSGYRGYPQPNDAKDDRGWTITYRIPFSSLGLSDPPKQDSSWGIALVIHDRDDTDTLPNPDKTWPINMEDNKPDTWGRLNFGLPEYRPPEGISPGGIVTIRHKLDGANVVDGMVGGGMNCGSGLDFWTEWGLTNYMGTEQVNVQNEYDISDWPCFSKFYITFPLDILPQGKKIISATLTLTSVGNAGGGEWGPPGESIVQVMTASQEWGEANLNWNNAPLALENVSMSKVEPVAEDWPYPPGIPQEWDLSYAVDQAYSAGDPLRLVLYSADGDYNTGRYFATSETGDFIKEGRPTLDVVWGKP